MKLQIERRYVENLINNFPHLQPLKDQLRFGNKVEVFYRQLAEAEWLYLQQLYGHD